MKIVGLTGGIASGKSTVSRILEQNAVPIIDADKVAREVVEVGSDGLAQVVKIFGPQVLTESGELNRHLLGSLIFKDELLRQQLNGVLQPLIRQRFKDRIEQLRAQQAELIVLDLPLLYEMQYEALCDEIIVVYVSEKVQLQRLMERNNYSQQEAEERMAAQLSLEEKRVRADVIFENDGKPTDLERQVLQWLEKTKNAILTEDKH